METPGPKYKHKPSEKHTLEEVLKSLQDLIHNDLIEGDAGTGKPEASTTPARQPDAKPTKAPEPKQRRESKPVAREDFAPVSPGSGAVNLDAVMRSLRDLIGNELNVGDEPAPAKEAPASTHEEYLSTEERIEEYIPDELAELDEELKNLDKHIRDETEATPLGAEFSASVENIEASLPKELTPFDEDLTLEAVPVPESPPAAPVASAEPAGETAAPVPEEFTPLDEELTFEATPAPEPASVPLNEATELPGDIVPELGQNLGEPAPEEFTPLDEELTFETPLEAVPPPATLIETAELPGEISPELLEEPVAPPPAAVTPTPEADIAPGTQHDMFLEAAPPSAPEPEAAATDTAPAAPMEATSVPESQVPAEKLELSVEAPTESAAEALPTIDVEENFDDQDYFTATPSDETPPPASESEETIALDAELPSDTATATPAVTESATAPETPAKSVAASAPPGEKIELEAAQEPAPEKPLYDLSVDFDSSDLSPPLPEEPEIAPPSTEAIFPPAGHKPQNSYLVDFDSSDLSPPLPEESDLAPPETGMTAKSHTPVETVKADSTEAPEQEAAAPAAPPPEPPAVEAKAETPAEAPSPQSPTETASPEAEAPAPSALDDIPVLNEVVAPPAGRKRAARPKAPSAQPPLPAPDRARELVVRAVAKLNVEMRKTGGAGLDTKTILRLQQLIREELEKGGGK